MSARDDFQEVIDLGEGVYRVKYHKLNTRSLKNWRSRLLGEVFQLRREMGGLHDNLDEKQKRLREKQDLLNKLTDEKIQSYIETERKREKVVAEKANAFLRDYIGAKNYECLQTTGFFKFKAQDGKTYRIKKDGTLQEGSGTYWYTRCMLKPRNLPLPDVIASVFTAASKVKKGLQGSQRTGKPEVRS